MTLHRFTGIALAALVLGATFGPCAVAQAQTTQTARAPAASLVPAGSEISFTTRQMGVPVEGKFGKFTAQVALDPKQPASGSVAFSIDTNSARFGAAEIDAEIPKAIWLDSQRHPQASFQSSAIKAAGPGRFEVTGRLSIKGQSRDVVVPVQVVQAGATSTASGSFTIKRLDFKVGEAEWSDTSMLANDISVRFKLVLTGVPPL
jgi:polyisoprenoid-binding protein YceI